MLFRSVIATGLTKNPIALKITTGNLTLNQGGEMVTGGAVETILRAITTDSTVVMYQVDNVSGSGTSSVGQISVLVEATGAGPSNSGVGYQNNTPSTVATALATRIQALLGAASTVNGPTGTTTGGNIGIAGNVWAANTTVVSNQFRLY